MNRGVRLIKVPTEEISLVDEGLKPGSKSW
jgi:hypothetical protein